MSWNGVLVGVDASPQGVAAAETGARVAAAFDAPCWLVHGCRLMFDPPSTAEFLTDVNLLVTEHVERARRSVAESLAGRVPSDLIRGLEVRLGQPAGVVAEVAHERGADLIVVGGKHHTALARWIGGSTAHHLVRATDIPLLITGPEPGSLKRMLVAVDLSYALRPTFETAARVARTLGCEIRLVHVVEPLPVVAELPVTLSNEAFFADSQDRVRRALAPLMTDTPVDLVVRQGPAATVLNEEAVGWKADVVVVGSHGKGWMHRLLVGSMTEQLLNALPSSLLVVPVPAPQGGRDVLLPAVESGTDAGA